MRLRTKYTDGDCRLSITDPAAVSACTRYCIRTLKYTVNKASSLRDLSVIAGILWMRLRTKYADGDCRLSITDPAQSRRDDTLLTVYFSIRTWEIPIEKQRTDDTLLSVFSFQFGFEVYFPSVYFVSLKNKKTDIQENSVCLNSINIYLTI
jgi:hypothetical protein